MVTKRGMRSGDMKYDQEGQPPSFKHAKGTRARWLGPVQARRCTVRLAQVPPSLLGALHVDACTRLLPVVFRVLPVVFRLLPVVFDLLPVVFDLQGTFEVTVDFRWRASFSPPQLWRVTLSGGPCPLDVFLVRPRCRPRAWRLTPSSHLTYRPPALDAFWARRC